MSALALPDLSRVALNINASHRLAQISADEAIRHAKAAGEMLKKVKAELGHGRFSQWIELHCEFSTRQARRYIQAANGIAPTPRSLKTDTVSDLNALLPHEFEPSPVHWMVAMHDEAVYCIEPALQRGFFFVSRMKLIGELDAECWYLTKPIHGAAVEMVLRDAGMPEPTRVNWGLGRSSGVRAALQVPA